MRAAAFPFGRLAESQGPTFPRSGVARIFEGAAQFIRTLCDVVHLEDGLPFVFEVIGDSLWFEVRQVLWKKR